MATPTSKIRRKVLKRAGVLPAPYTKRMQTVDEQPDKFPKTDKMKVLELRYHLKLEDIIFKGSLTDVVKQFGNEVERSTVSKWRKYIRIALVDASIARMEGE